MMQDLTVTEGDLDGRDLKIAIVASRFNELIVESLVRGAVDALVRHGVARPDIELVRVPGAWELPLAARAVAASRRFDAIVALGAVIRGATPHFDYVAGQCGAGLAEVSLNHQVPVGFGVLTVDSIEQALERAGTKAGNKGAEAAATAIEMARLVRRLDR